MSKAVSKFKMKGTFDQMLAKPGIVGRLAASLAARIVGVSEEELLATARRGVELHQARQSAQMAQQVQEVDCEVIEGR